MGARNKTILERIKDLIGDDVTDIVSYKDLIDAGFNYVADMIPAKSEMWVNSFTPSTSVSLVDEGLDAADIKILRVWRRDASEAAGVTRVCKEITYAEYMIGQDHTSIYYHAGNYKNPTYTINWDGDILITPSVGAGDNWSIAYFKYYTVGYPSDPLIDAKNLASAAMGGFPAQAEYLGVTRASTNLLHAKIKRAVQDDEDQELLGLLNTQLQTLDKIMQEEMKRLNIPSKEVGAQEDV